MLEIDVKVVQNFLLALLIFLAVLIYYKFHSNLDIHWIRFILILPLCIFLSCIASFGLGTFMAALNIKYRDFRYLIPFMIQTMLFITPVIYPISVVQSTILKNILAINPMYAAIELLRGSMTGFYPDIQLIIISIFSSFVLLFIGIFFFRKTEYYFADLI